MARLSKAPSDHPPNPFKKDGCAWGSGSRLPTIVAPGGVGDKQIH
jgi:hypothetical protein